MIKQNGHTVTPIVEDFQCKEEENKFWKSHYLKVKRNNSYRFNFCNSLNKHTHKNYF